MRERCPIKIVFPALLLLVALQPANAQMGFSIDVKKPEPYENRVLKAEKTPTDKKIKAPKRFFQNLTTHYNYFFNANNKLNEVILRAKQSNIDDYSQLLPFYNYSLDATASEELQLDSVIYKSQTGIVMHDLRSDWVDNMYMLWGGAYYFKKQFDSASLMFQFINYAFAEKEKDGYYRYIGSRMDGNNALSVSTKENNSFTKKIFSTSPSRNEAFIWQIRSLIELGDMNQAGSMIATLKNDPVFPERLFDQLEEVQAYWFYKQQMWDSSAFHLLKALDVATTKQEKARWEYLAAQMLEKKGKNAEAQDLYSKAISHGTDPIMDVYARLNLVKLNTEGGENYIDQNIAELLKMARRDRFEDYRDIIYFMAAQMEMERGNFAAAKQHLLKAAKYNNGNLSPASNAFLLIADLSYDQKQYVQAASFYDSIQIGDLKELEATRVESRKPPLAKVVAATNVIERQDSLQRIAAMPEEERKELINKLVKKLRKQQGLGDENAISAGSGNLFPSGTNAPTDLFTNQSKGEWYFYNNNLKIQGAAQFRQTWGNRPNTDNWRRFSNVSNQLQAKVPVDTRDNKGVAISPDVDNSPSYVSLSNKLPLTPEAMQVSNDSINNALFDLGSVYLNEIEDYQSAIETFEKLRSRMPTHPRMDEVLFGLYFSYTKTGDFAKASEIKKLMTSNYGSSRYTEIVTTGKDPGATTKISPEATKDYEAIYDMFIEGRFDEAQAAKKIADSVYQTNYWEPQLLYIEAVYNIRQRNDSTAKNILNTLIAQNDTAGLASKAKTMLDVLNRRKQIEEELTNLQITRPVEDTVKLVQQPPPPVVEERLPLAKRDTTLSKTKQEVAVVSNPVRPVDTLSKRSIVVPKKQNTVYVFEPSFKHYAVVVLNKVDAVFSGETRNAFHRFNRERYYTQPLEVNASDLDSANKLILIGEFLNAQEALEYMQLAKRLAPSEIIPWLKADKYSFYIISKENLEVLQNLKDLTQYKKFLDQNLPGKF